MNLIKTLPMIAALALQGLRVFILSSDGSENVMTGGTIGNMEAKNIVETIEETYLLFNKDNVVPIPLPKMSKHYREMYKDPKYLYLLFVKRFRIYSQTMKSMTTSL